MKKSLKIAAAVIAAGAVITFAGCGGCSCAGCGGNSKNLAVVNSNWYTGTSYKGIQPSFIYENDPDNNTREIITYTVTHDKSDAGNGIYSADYKEGSFTTTFYAFKYNWNENKVYPGDEEEILYAFETELEIKVQYTYTATNEQTDWYEDGISSVAFFRAAGKQLQPVYSRQEIKSHSPASLQPASIEYVCEYVEETYENFYNFDCTAVTTVNGEESNVYEGLDDIKYTVFDNSSLYIAARSLKLSESLSQTIYLYSAASGGPAEYVITGADTALDSTEEQNEINYISEEMEEKGLFFPDDNRNTVPTVAVNIDYAGGDLHGTTQTVWYAAIENADYNVGRTTMLKISTPLSYSLGTLNYSLNKIESTLWND